MKKSSLFSLLLCLLAFTTFLILTSEQAWAGPRRVCAKEDGSIVVKRRCREVRNEMELSLTELTGPTGPEGPAGPAGMVGLVEVMEMEDGHTINDNSVNIVTADCPEGKIAISGTCRVPISVIWLYTSWIA